MKDIIIAIITLILAFLITAKPEISFSPFSISFKDIYKGIGLVLLILSIAFFYVSAHREGINDGHTEAINYIKENYTIKKK